MLDNPKAQMIPMIQAMQAVVENIQTCPICGNFDTQNPCNICANDKKNKKQVCVVRDIADLWALDRANIFHGVYHVLGGVLSALDGVGPDDLKIDKLIGRIQMGEIEEVILALPATVDGQTTAHYVADRLEKYPVQLTTLARGVPVGGELDYLDDGTLQMALKSRRSL